MSAAALLTPTPAHAQAPSVQAARGGSGFNPDAQLTGGLGFGFEAKLDNLFLGRVRLGALYAKAPWIASLGLSAEVGALAGLGLGGELELSHSAGPFGSVGVARVDGAHWMAHAGLGFMIVGLEWQHVFGATAPHNALLLEVRLPLGIWWLQKRQQREAERPLEPAHAPQVVPRGPTPLTPPQTVAPLTAAGVSAAPAKQAPTVAEPVIDREAQAAEAEARLAEARQAHDRGDGLAEAIALSRAYALRPQPEVALQLAAAELRLGKPRAALADWERVGALASLSAEERARAHELKQEILAGLAHLRVSFEGTLDAADVVTIDAAPEHGATLGYDIPLDPGRHKLQWLRGQRVLFERELDAQPGALLRVSLPAVNE